MSHPHSSTVASHPSPTGSRRFPAVRLLARLLVVATLATVLVAPALAIDVPPADHEPATTVDLTEEDLRVSVPGDEPYYLLVYYEDVATAERHRAYVGPFVGTTEERFAGTGIRITAVEVHLAA